MADLSILIPARNEMFLSRTVEDILKNIRGNTEVIVVIDGEFAGPPLPVDPRVRVIENKESLGQRAATNQACRLSEAKYVAKCDAHCAFDEGFDVKLMADMQDDWTITPVMRNLHAFDWVCSSGHRRYQGPSGPCLECGAETTRDVVWIPKTNPQSRSFCFDATPHFQYFNEFTKRPEGKGDLTETMSLQGSFFMLTREKYWELNICDESFGSWGSQGIEVAVKTWLSGGRVMVNHKTWYAHMFRTQGGDFGFPYPQKGSQVLAAKKKAKEMFFDGSWEAKYPLSWLVEKFWPVPGWTEADLKKIKEPKTVGLVYYTRNKVEPKIRDLCINQIKKNFAGPIVSVSLEPVDLGKNIIYPRDGGPLTMFKKILTGLEALDTDYAFLIDDDVLYHATHFDFIPPKDDVYYYNRNVWRVRTTDGHALQYDYYCGCCANRELLVKHYRERVRRCEAEGLTDDSTRGFRRMGFEAGTHNRPEKIDEYKADVWRSEGPNIDIRHKQNLTSSRWKKEEFRSQRNCQNWKESTIDHIEGWEDLQVILD